MALLERSTIAKKVKFEKWYFLLKKKKKRIGETGEREDMRVVVRVDERGRERESECVWVLVCIFYFSYFSYFLLFSFIFFHSCTIGSALTCQVKRYNFEMLFFVIFQDGVYVI